MDCNKDEACRAKEIAEKKLAENDIVGAKKFASKAQQLFPKLDGLQQMMTILDVHLAAQKQFNGVIDFYGILHVNTTAEETTIRKHYKQLALVLHPDKNKVVGAESAFKMVSEAWSILSDKEKRQNYDLIRNSIGFQSRIQTHRNATRHAQCSNDFFNLATPLYSKHATNPNAFWTGCPNCRTLYEYERRYLYDNLPCLKCQFRFLAVEIPFRPGFQWPFNTSAGRDQLSRFSVPQQQQQQQTQHNNCQQHTQHNNCEQYQQFPIQQQQQTQHSNRQQYSGNQRQHTNCKPFYRNHTAVSASGVTGYPASTRVDSFSRPACRWAPFPTPPVHSCNGTGSKEAVVNYQQQTYERLKKERDDAWLLAKIRDELSKWNGQSQKTGFETNGSPSPPTLVPLGTKEWSEQMFSFIRKRKRQIDGESEQLVGDIAAMQNMAASTLIGGSIRKPLGKEKHTDNIAFGNGERNIKKTVSVQEQQKPVLREMLNKKNSDTNRIKASGRHPSNKDSQLSMRNSFIQLARKVIQKHLQESESVTKYASISKENEETIISTDKTKANSPLHENKSSKVNERERAQLDETSSKVEIKDGMCPRNGNLDSVDPETMAQSGDSNSIDPQAVSMLVPDPDIHDFDQERTEKCVKENQVWAIYDDDDGMPRYYALIHKVISLEPFKVGLRWLTAKRNDDTALTKWMNAGFTKTCGHFTAGKTQKCDNICVFSHVIRWEKASKGVFKIFPKKGDVWALYTEWSPDWNESTPSEATHKYNMVEVLSDLTEEGISVVPLMKVTGFKTVFRKKESDPETIQWVPRKELCRFSHQVPSYVFTGEEDKNIPKDYRELDPAATPLELLQVVKAESNVSGKC